MPRIVHEKTIQQALEELGEVYSGLVAMVGLDSGENLLNAAVMLYGSLPPEADQGPRTPATAPTTAQPAARPATQARRDEIPGVDLTLSAYCACDHRCWPSTYEEGQIGPMGCCNCEKCGCRGHEGYRRVDVSQPNDRYPRWQWKKINTSSGYSAQSTAMAYSPERDGDLPFE